MVVELFFLMRDSASQELEVTFFSVPQSKYQQQYIAAIYKYLKKRKNGNIVLRKEECR